MSIHYNPHLLPKVRSAAIMAAAHGAPCTLRICSLMGQRCWSRETTVACHLPIWGKGIGTKVTDMAVAFGCGGCHAIIDGVDQQSLRLLEEKYPAILAQRMLHALTETQALLLSAGIITVPDGEII
jgi:hypothetical protein